MKMKIAAAVLFAAAALMVAPRPAEAYVSVSISFFHQELAPYGRWVYTPAYGEVWYPTVVRSGWAPYVDGEWVYTDCGWTWVSYDPFSDPFHYGTWVWVDAYGWSWVPGYVWGPAWVTWAWTDSYVGWAPLPPTFAITASGYYGSAVTVSTSRYVFVPVDRFAGTNVSTVRVASTQNPTILAGAHRATQFSVSNGLVRTGGPKPSLVERATGRPVHPVKVSSLKVRPATITSSMTAGRGRLSIVAPARERAAGIKQSRAASQAPPRVARREAIRENRTPPKAVAGRSVEKQKQTAPARVSRTERDARNVPRGPAVEKRGPKPQARSVERKPAGPPREARSVEKKREMASPQRVQPAPRIREERRSAMNRPPEQPRAPRREAPPPRVQQPPPGPPPGASNRPPERSQPQGQGQGKGPKKEKGDR